MQNVEQFYQLIDNGQISEANAFFTGIYNHLKPASSNFGKTKSGLPNNS